MIFTSQTIHCSRCDSWPRSRHFRHCPTVGHTGASIDGKHGFVDDCIRANHETRTVDSDRSRSGCRLPWFELTCESH